MKRRHPLQLVDLKRGQSICRAGRRIEPVYFQVNAVVAMIDRLEVCRTIEVGECYRFIRRQYDELRVAVPRLLSS